MAISKNVLRASLNNISFSFILMVYNQCTIKEGNILFNDAINTFYLWLYGIRHVVKDQSNICRHMGISFRLAARVLLYAPSQTG